jgi:mannose-6-phosphate isomerase-like protein (cupin superfamily)
VADSRWAKTGPANTEDHRQVHAPHPTPLGKHAAIRAGQQLAAFPETWQQHDGKYALAQFRFGGEAVAGIERKSLNTPDETRRPDKTNMEVVTVGGRQAARITLQPGWKWSECIKPVAKTDSCQAEHLGYVVSGRLHVVHDDGNTVELNTGDAYLISPGHDAWVIGNEPLVGLEFSSAATYAKG